MLRRARRPSLLFPRPAHPPRFFLPELCAAIPFEHGGRPAPPTALKLSK